ncbi:hypothetical protein GCM10027057_21780 [Marisediminicola antarctica]
MGFHYSGVSQPGWLAGGSGWLGTAFIIQESAGQGGWGTAFIIQERLRARVGGCRKVAPIRASGARIERFTQLTIARHQTGCRHLLNDEERAGPKSTRRSTGGPSNS